MGGIFSFLTFYVVVIRPIISAIYRWIFKVLFFLLKGIFKSIVGFIKYFFKTVINLGINTYNFVYADSLMGQDQRMEDLGVSNNKKIPFIYRFASQFVFRALICIVIAGSVISTGITVGTSPIVKIHIQSELLNMYSQIIPDRGGINFYHKDNGVVAIIQDLSKIRTEGNLIVFDKIEAYPLFTADNEFEYQNYRLRVVSKKRSMVDFIYKETIGSKLTNTFKNVKCEVLGYREAFGIPLVKNSDIIEYRDLFGLIPVPMVKKKS